MIGTGPIKRASLNAFNHFATFYVGTLESLAWKRAAIKTQMICLTSFFCSCEYASDIFPHVFSPTGGFVPKTVERGQKNMGGGKYGRSAKEARSREAAREASVDVIRGESRRSRSWWPTLSSGQGTPAAPLGKWHQLQFEILDLSISGSLTPS